MFVRALARVVSGRAFRRFEAACKAPEAAQAALWRATYARLHDAPFWRGKLSQRLSDMPLSTYADYQATLSADLARTTSSLNGEAIDFWAESSGTTGQPKLFPMTATYRAQFQTVNLPFVHGLIRRFPGFLKKRVLYFTSPGPTAWTPAGIGTGFISGYNYLNTPPLLAKTYALPREVLRDAATYQRWASVYAVAADVGAILAVTPARVRLMAEDIAARKDEIVDTLASAAGARAFEAAGLPRPRVTKARMNDIRAALSPRAGAPERLDHGRLGHGRLDLGRLWPALEVVGAWRTSACALQLASLEPYLPPRVARVDVIYSATEGWVNVPLETTSTGGPIHPGAVICELLPLGATDASALCAPWQIEPGQEYEIILTNVMGLVRYRLFDVVRCTGWYHRSPVVEFVGKASRELVVGMIRLSEAQLVAALGASSLAAHPALVFAPRPTGDGLVLWLRDDIAIDPRAVLAVDLRLQADNAYYRRDVGSGLFRPLEARTLSAAHPLWARLSGGAQTKPRLYLERLDEAELDAGS